MENCRLDSGLLKIFFHSQKFCIVLVVKNVESGFQLTPICVYCICYTLYTVNYDTHLLYIYGISQLKKDIFNIIQFFVYSIMCNVQCTVYAVHFHSPLYMISTLHSLHCTLCTVHYTLYTLYNVQCTLYILCK